MEAKITPYNEKYLPVKYRNKKSWSKAYIDHCLQQDVREISRIERMLHQDFWNLENVNDIAAMNNTLELASRALERLGK